MLVLSRQRDETIMIGDEIEITVVDIRGDKIRLGITAPARIAVHRKEVYEAIGRENQQAALTVDLVTTATPIVGTIKPGPAKGRPAKNSQTLTTPSTPTSPSTPRRISLATPVPAGKNTVRPPTAAPKTTARSAASGH